MSSHLLGSVPRGGTRTLVAVGTTDGGYLLTSDSSREKWRKSPKFLGGESVNSFAFNPKTRVLYAATHTEGVFRSRDLGKTWKPASRGLNVRKVWTFGMDARRPAVMYAGTHYGHLFKTEDGGDAWAEVVGLHSAPGRAEWGVDWAMGTTGLCIHTVRIDPANQERIYLVASGNGTYRSDDAGKAWRRIRNGQQDSCPVGGWEDPTAKEPLDDATKMREHLKNVHGCTHKVVLSSKVDGLVYQQNHCGVYESRDFGDNWVDISPGEKVRHGFPLVLTENGSSALFTVPAFQGVCKKHNSCIVGRLAVYRKDGMGWRELTEGLPKGVHTCVLRDGMATDHQREPGVYFGTTTGEVYGSTDLGESWFTMMKGAGRVQGVNSFLL